jgi:phage shock protein A
MALLERVSTLVRANLNDLIDRAEDPEKMLRQVIVDLENQMLQVKTQVAIAIADHHLLQKRKKENEEKGADWMRKAELAVDKKQDDLARTAIDRSMSFRQMATSFEQQIEDQAVQVDNLKSALSKLEMKLEEARNKSELLIAQHRRARAACRAGDARLRAESGAQESAFDRMNRKVQTVDAMGQAKTELLVDSVEDQFAKLEREDQIDKLLADLKARRG